MMVLRRTRSESALVIYTVALIAIYGPLETWVSFPRLLSLFYLVDAIGLALLLAGVLMYRANARIPYTVILAIGYGWLGANFWRGMAMRLEANYDPAQWPEGKIVAVGATGIAVGGAVLVGLCVVGMILSILVARRDSRQLQSTEPTL